MNISNASLMNMQQDCVIEKKSKMKEIMVMYGVSYRSYVLSWIASYASVDIFIITGVIVADLLVLKQYTQSNQFLLYCVFIMQYLDYYMLAQGIAAVIDDIRTGNVLVVLMNWGFIALGLLCSQRVEDWWNDCIDDDQLKNVLTGTKKGSMIVF